MFTSNPLLRERHSHAVRPAMADADSNTLNPCGIGCSLRITMQHYLWSASSAHHNLNIAQGCRSALGLHNVVRLKDSFLGGPTTRKASLRVRAGETVRSLGESEVALEERLIVDVDRGRELDIDTDTLVACLLLSDGLEYSLGSQDIARRLGRHNGGVVEMPALLFLGVHSTSLRVEVNTRLQVVAVWRFGFDLNEVADAGQRVVQVSIGLGLTFGVADLVGIVLGLLESTQDVVGTGFEAVGLDRFGRVENIFELAQYIVDVISVAVAWSDAGGQGLDNAVEHPAGGRPLGMTSKVLLGDCQAAVTLGTAQMSELLVQDAGFVLVVGLGAGPVEGCNTDIIDGQTISGQSTTESGDLGVLTPELHAPGAEGILFLTPGLLVDELSALGEPIFFGDGELAVGLEFLQFLAQEFVLVLDPAGDLLAAGAQLSGTVLDVQKRRLSVARYFASGGEDTRTRSRNGATFLVRSGVGQGDYTVDGSTDLDSHGGGHQDVVTRTLGLHETAPGRGSRARHLTRGTAMSKFVDSVAGCLHVCKLVRRLLGNIFCGTGNHDFSLASLDGLHGHFDRYSGGGASVDGGLDGARGTENKQVDPSRHGIDEGLLKDILLDGFVQEPVPVESTESTTTTNTAAGRVSDLGDMDILVELVRIGDTRGYQRFHSRHNVEERDLVNLIDDVLGNAIAGGVPTGRDRAGDEAVEAQRLRNIDGGALLDSDGPAARFRLEGIDLVSVLKLEMGGLFLATFEWLKFVVDDNLLHKVLFVGVVATPLLGFNQTDTGVLQNLLFILALDVLVLDWLVRLGVDPAGVLLVILLQRTMMMFDVTHDPGHLNAPFKRKLAIGLHLPTSAAVTPRTNLTKASDNDDLIEINETLEIAEVLKLLVLLEFGEIELHVRARGDFVGLVLAFRLGTVDDSVVQCIVGNDGLTDICRLANFQTKFGREFLHVRDVLETTIEICPEGFVLAELEHRRVHQAKDIERHLDGREGANAKLLDTFGDHIVGAHQTGTTGPAAINK
ncbi:hypothetical protein BC936DRAFT_146377 [Jimgerdemannia flammicorona]|uniref:Uncharacterized protein n=1 Tax=Jimgerdemannia flammicorona TaxID=994334 RepID=A0A433D7S8_9FUNG|nr:hypothetical protein BC936DRAFT_146377 [Jimgerdemannia flammicorona]